MTPEQFAKIKKRAITCAKLISPIDPTVTAKGGIVLLYGPYSPSKANKIADYYRHLNTDIPAMIAEIDRLRAIEQAAKKFIEANGPAKYHAFNDLRITMGYVLE